MCDFFVNLDDFFGVVYTDFHEVVICTRYVPILISTNWRLSVLKISALINILLRVEY